MSLKGIGWLGMVYQEVLLVDDEPAFRRVIARNLRSRGVSVREAASAEEALHEIRAMVPALLLLDLNLPDQTGWDVLRELRRVGIHVPTIVISAVHAPTARLDEFRPLAYLPKPFPIDALLRLVVGPQAAPQDGAPGSAAGHPTSESGPGKAAEG
jgi:DNA-binding response OmpR family regulator